jgi:hypothetical protein
MRIVIISRIIIYKLKMVLTLEEMVPDFSETLRISEDISKFSQQNLYTIYNSVALVRKRATPTVQPPPVGKVSGNFCG